MTDDVDYPRDVRIDKPLRDDYDRLVSRQSSPFYGQEKSDLFAVAAALGWQANRREKSSDRYVLFPRNALSEEKLWVIKVIAIADYGDVEILQNGRETIRRGEEYANGGMRVLTELYEGPDDLVREVTNRMIEAGTELQDVDYP